MTPLTQSTRTSLCLLLALSSSASAGGGRSDDTAGADATGENGGVGGLRGGAIGVASEQRGLAALAAGGTLSFPLVPHAAHVERRRRELKERSGVSPGETDDAAAAISAEQDGYDDESRFEGWPRRRRYLIDDDDDEEEGGDEKDVATAADGKKKDRPPQVGALWQGYGTHYLDVWMGHPKPQRQTVIVDTGSGITAFPCSGCPKAGCGDGYHTDDPFDEKASDTFEKMSECADCTLGRCKPTYGLDGKGGVTKTGGECKVTMSYQEGSSWEAYEAEDMVYAGGMHAEAVVPDEKQLEAEKKAGGIDGADPSMAPAYRFKMRFACQTLLTGLFKTQLADGIMGMENSESSFWYQMYENYAAPSRTFSLCFSRGSNYEAAALKSGAGAGALTLGGSDDRLHATPLLYAENLKSRGWYTVYVTAVYLRAGGGESAVAPEGSDPDGLRRLDVKAEAINRGGIIVDSGTTDTYLPSALGGPFKEAWKAVTGNYPPEPKKRVTLSPQEVAELPTILLQLRAARHSTDSDPLRADGADPAHFPGAAGSVDPEHPEDVVLAVPALHYMEPRLDGGEGEYSMRVHFTEKSGGVLGANTMMGHDVVFDLDNGRVGFAESLCDYDEVRDGKGEDAR